MPAVVHERRFWGQSFLRRQLFTLVCALLCASFCGVTAQAFCQTPTAPPSTTTRPKVTHHARHLKAKAVPVEQPSAPPAPVYPLPPAQQTPVPASVQYHDNQLTIQAKNSDLSQILMEVSQRTGLEVKGLSQDQRVFGQYGPGTVNQTLGKLLDGSSYNYVIIGGDATHPPKQLLLTGANGAFPSTTSAAGSMGTTQTGTPATTTPVPAGPVTAQQMMDAYRRQHPQPTPQQQDTPPPPEE